MDSEAQRTETVQLDEEMDGAVEDEVVPNLDSEPLYTPTPYDPPIAREGYHFVNGWEVPNTHVPIVPTGWGTDESEEDLPHFDV